ncbi:MAG: hypothetical protein V4612_00410 [Pseudomonadota bacterium]
MRTEKTSAVETPANNYKDIVGKFKLVKDVVSDFSNRKNLTADDFDKYRGFASDLAKSLGLSEIQKDADGKIDPASVSLEGFKTIFGSLKDGFDAKLNIQPDQKEFTEAQRDILQAENKPFIQAQQDCVDEFAPLSEGKEVNPISALKNLKENNKEPSLADSFKNAAQAIFNLLKSIIKFLFGLDMGQEEQEQKEAEKAFGDLLAFFGLSPKEREENKDKTRQGFINDGAKPIESKTADETEQGELSDEKYKKTLEADRKYAEEEKKFKETIEITRNIATGKPTGTDREKRFLDSLKKDEEAKKPSSLDDIFENLAGDIKDVEFKLQKEKNNLQDRNTRAARLGIDLESSQQQNKKADDKAQEFVNADKPKTWVEKMAGKSQTKSQSGAQEAPF